jgi:putative transposase
MKSVSRSFVYGVASFTRASIPESLADFEFLPTVDTEALSEEARSGYALNLDAYRLFVLEPEVTLAEIHRRTGIHQKQLYRLIDRVVSKAEDGLIQGLRGLIPGKHLKAYTRVATVASSSKLQTSSAAGALEQLLNKYPHVREWLKREAKKRNEPLKKGEMRQIRKAITILHGEFLDKCHAAGVGAHEWPFNQDYRGYRSFAKILKRYELQCRDGHPKAGEAARDTHDPKEEGWPIALQPFMIVQFDGHKVDLRVTIAITDPFGMETLIEISRIWILVLTDVRTRAILGFSIALGPEYNKDDFAEALQASLTPHKRVQFTIPGLKVKDGGGFPTELQPELAYHRWMWFQFDEAKAHLANDSLERLTRVLGSWTVAGRLGEPDDRAIEERLFGILEECGFHRIPGTLGSNPKDPRRKLGDVGSDLDRIIRLDELEQIIYVLLANRNAENQAGVGDARRWKQCAISLQSPNLWCRRCRQPSAINCSCCARRWTSRSAAAGRAHMSTSKRCATHRTRWQGSPNLSARSYASTTLGVTSEKSMHFSRMEVNSESSLPASSGARRLIRYGSGAKSCG